MAASSEINRTFVEALQISGSASDINIRIPIGDGTDILFTAEQEFFTPRKIATNKADVIDLKYALEYTPNNTPIIKLSYDIATPQYYSNSIVRDVYKIVPIDNFFQELYNDLAVPDDPFIKSLRDQRDAALQAALALEDLAAAVAVGDQDGIDEANADIVDNLDTSEGIRAETPDPEAVLTPEEQDELSVLDFVGLTSDYGNTDAAADIIDPLPEVLDSDLIQRLPLIAGKAKGTVIINKAISLLNSGLENVENTTNEEGKCKRIVIAKGKKGFLGVGKTQERTVLRVDIEKQLATVNSEIKKQKSTNSPIPGYYKYVSKTGIFTRAINAVQNFSSKAGFVGQLLGAMIAQPFLPGAIAEAAFSKSKKLPMNKAEILLSLEATKTTLDNILAKEC